MSELLAVDLGSPTLLEFRGPDAVRFLNGQLTQDVRKVAGAEISVPSCITDAKGKLQFRVTLTESPDGTLWMEGAKHSVEDLEARVTRYLIADDVEVTDLTGEYALVHLFGGIAGVPAGVIARKSNRYGVPGTDWWIPLDHEFELPPQARLLSGDDLEAIRIANGIPAWSHELTEGMLPPEALLEETDISYNKGCYIGQEVISRIKSAGKVNRRLTRFQLDPELHIVPGPLENGVGEITSVSPAVVDGVRHALGYVKRGVTELFYKAADGATVSVRLV